MYKAIIYTALVFLSYLATNIWFDSCIKAQLVIFFIPVAAYEYLISHDFSKLTLKEKFLIICCFIAMVVAGYALIGTNQEQIKEASRLQKGMMR